MLRVGTTVINSWLLLRSSHLTLMGLGLGLLAFYQGHALPLVLVGLLLFVVLALRRPDLALLAVPCTAPFFLIPASITGVRSRPILLPLHEVALLVVAGVIALRWLAPRIWRPAASQRAEAARPAAHPVARQHWLVRHIPEALLVLAGILGIALAVPEARGAALREFRWLIVEPLIFYALLTATMRAWAPRYARQVLVAFIVGGVLVALVGLLQFAGLDLVWLFGDKQAPTTSILEDEGLRRVTSVYGSPNNLGLYLGRVWPMAAAAAGALWIGMPSGARRGAWLFAAGALLCLAAIVVTFSRGAWLAAGVALVVLVLPAIWRRGRRMMPGVVMAGAVLMLVAGLALSLRGGLAGSNARMRTILWHEAILLIQRHPLGIGLDQFYYYHNPTYGRSLLDPTQQAQVEPYAAHPHNLILDAWLRLGPLGVVAFAALFARFIRSALAAMRTSRDPSARYLALGALAALAATVVHGLVDNFYFVPDLAIAFWVLLALVEYYRCAGARSGSLSAA